MVARKSVMTCLLMFSMLATIEILWMHVSSLPVLFPIRQTQTQNSEDTSPAVLQQRTDTMTDILYQNNEDTSPAVLQERMDTMTDILYQNNNRSIWDDPSALRQLPSLNLNLNIPDLIEKHLSNKTMTLVGDSTMAFMYRYIIACICHNLVDDAQHITTPVSDICPLYDEYNMSHNIIMESYLFNSKGPHYAANMTITYECKRYGFTLIWHNTYGNTIPYLTTDYTNVSAAIQYRYEHVYKPSGKIDILFWNYGQHLLAYYHGIEGHDEVKRGSKSKLFYVNTNTRDCDEYHGGSWGILYDAFLLNDTNLLDSRHQLEYNKFMTECTSSVPIVEWCSMYNIVNGPYMVSKRMRDFVEDMQKRENGHNVFLSDLYTLYKDNCFCHSDIQQ
eukprot:304150_1